MQGFWNRHKAVWMLGIGLIVGLALGAILFQNQTDTIEDMREKENTTESAALDGNDVVLSAQQENTRQPIANEDFVTDDVVHVKDQQAGTLVFVSRVELQHAGWVAVQEKSGGQPGPILGAARFDAGVYQGTVRLLRPTEVGMMYYATLWYDDGDKTFDHTKDTLLGQTDVMQFETF